MHQWRMTAVAAALAIATGMAAEEAVRKELAITSFEEAKPTLPALEVGAWFPPGESLFEESRTKDADEQRNWVLQIDYKFLTARAYGGIYIKWDATDFDFAKYSALSFYLKGGDSYPPVMKAELKISGPWGWRIQYIEMKKHSIGDKWVRLDLPLDDFTPVRSKHEKDAEIVLTLEEEQTTRRGGAMSGTFFVDHFCFVERPEAK